MKEKIDHQLERVCFKIERLSRTMVQQFMENETFPGNRTNEEYQAELEAILKKYKARLEIYLKPYEPYMTVSPIPSEIPSHRVIAARKVFPWPPEETYGTTVASTIPKEVEGT